MDARIGTLSTGEYYAYPNGYSENPVKGTLQEVEEALGLEATPTCNKPAELKWNTYLVTITTAERTDEIEIDQVNRSKAISEARAWYRSEYAPYPLPAKYRAQIKRS